MARKPPVLVPPDVASELEALSKSCLADLAWDLLGAVVGVQKLDQDPFDCLAFYLRSVLADRGDDVQRLASTARLRAALARLADQAHRAAHAHELAEALAENPTEPTPVEPEVAAEAEEEIRAALARGDQARLAAMNDPELELAMRITREETG